MPPPKGIRRISAAIYEIAPAGGCGRWVDDLRYGGCSADVAPAGGGADEYAILRIRYKLPRAGAAG